MARKSSLRGDPLPTEADLDLGALLPHRSWKPRFEKRFAPSVPQALIYHLARQQVSSWPLLLNRLQGGCREAGWRSRSVLEPIILHTQG
jgi:hypothetical protein